MKKKLIRTVWRKLFPPTQLDLILDEVESRLADYEAWQVTQKLDKWGNWIYYLWSPKPTPLGIYYNHEDPFQDHTATAEIADPEIKILNPHHWRQGRLNKMVRKFVFRHRQEQATKLEETALQKLKGQKKPK